MLRLPGAVLSGQLLLQADAVCAMCTVLLSGRLLFEANAPLLPVGVWLLSGQLLLQTVSAILLAAVAGAL